MIVAKSRSVSLYPSKTHEEKTKSIVSIRVLLYLAASAVQGVLSFLTLPLATIVLGPSDYGVYATLTALTLFVSAATDCGQNVLFSGHYATLDDEGRRSLYTTALVVSLVVACILCWVFVWLWPWVERVAKVDYVVTSATLWTAALSIPFRAIVTHVSQYFVVAGDSVSLATMIVVQSITTFVVTLTALFAFDAHVLSLFLGATVGIAVAATYSLYRLRGCIVLLIDRRWMRALFKTAPSSVTAGIGANTQAAIENLLLSRFAGMAQVGYWAHARLYYGFLMQVTNAFAYAIWHRALREARDANSQFEVVGRTWSMVYVWLILAGVMFALLGSEIVALLTNGKFVDAAVWIPICVAYLLLQNSGKAATATVYALRKGVWAANLRVFTLLPSLGAMWWLVPKFGVGGILIALFLEMLLYRTLIGFYARTLRQLPFQDGWVIGGCALIFGIEYLVIAFEPQFSVRVVLAVAIVLFILIVGHRQVKETYEQMHALIRYFTIRD